MAGSCCRVKTCVLIAFRRERYSGIARLDQYSGGLSTTSKYPCSIVVDGVCDRAAGGKDRPEGDEPLGRVPRVSNGNLGLLHIAKQSICILLFPPEGLCSYLLASIKARRNVMELRTDTDSHEGATYLVRVTAALPTLEASSSRPATCLVSSHPSPTDCTTPLPALRRGIVDGLRVNSSRR
jgi:hypothetical protein